MMMMMIKSLHVVGSAGDKIEVVDSRENH